MVNPPIDFTYYRLKLSKKELNNSIRKLANRMSLFFAYPTPMMNVIHETTVKLLQSDGVPRENVTDALATMANVCQSMVERKLFVFFQP